MAAREAPCPQDAFVACTDGSGNAKTRHGAWAFVLYAPSGCQILTKSEAKVKTTNNEMEMFAAIQAIRHWKAMGYTRPLHIVSDSRYVIDGITNWVYGWRKRNYVTGEGKPVKNRQQWQTFFELCRSCDVTFEHVKGHSGHEGNELADQLCTKAVKSLSVGVDHQNGFISAHS